MYIKITTNGQGQSYYHLVESYWNKGKTHQRTLLSLGKVGADRLEDLISAISRHKEVMGILDLAKSISIEDTFIYGPLVILEWMFKEFGIDEALEKVEKAHPKLEIDLRKIVFTLVACRFIKPCSKLKIFEYWQAKLYPGTVHSVVGSSFAMVSERIELHHIYRSMDLLCEHKDEIERGIFWHKRDLLNLKVDVVLYDLTTIRFESIREDLGELRRFGYSKEMRSDCVQVVLGLLVDEEGIPLGFEVYAGNTFEGKTLENIVKKVREKFHVRRFIFVADRGLFSAKNLEHIRTSCGQEVKREQGEFIVGMKLGVFQKNHEEYYDRARFKRINDKLEVYETTHGQDRCIITWSKTRAERDRKAREDILEKIAKKLSSKKVHAKTFVSNQNYRKYLTGLDEGELKLNQKAIDEEAKRDGFFGVITNVRDMSAEEIIANYKKLWIIEDAFGEIKGHLKARPVFHWSDERIMGHLTLCFLAYFCEAQMTQVLRRKKVKLKSLAIEENIIDPRALTVVEAMRELCEVRSIPVKVRGKTIWVRTDIHGNAAKLFQTLGIKIPPKVLKLTA